jgi:hypothetical protein
VPQESIRISNRFDYTCKEGQVHIPNLPLFVSSSFVKDAVSISRIVKCPMYRTKDDNE